MCDEAHSILHLLFLPPGGREVSGEKMQTQATFKTCGRDGGLLETCFQTRRDTGSSRELEKEDITWVQRFPPLASGAATPSCRQPRRGAAERQAASCGFLADDVIFLSLVVFH